MTKEDRRSSAVGSMDVLGFLLHRSPRFDKPALTAPIAAARWRTTRLHPVARCGG